MGVTGDVFMGVVERDWDYSDRGYDDTGLDEQDSQRLVFDWDALTDEERDLQLEYEQWVDYQFSRWVSDCD
jgi:hypothetical protein